MQAPLLSEDCALQWVMAMPNVVPIQHATVDDCVEPVAHETKVSLAERVPDRPGEGRAAVYRPLANQCSCVLRECIALPEDALAAYAVVVANGPGLEGPRVRREPIPRRTTTRSRAWRARSMWAREHRARYPPRRLGAGPLKT